MIPVVKAARQESTFKTTVAVTGQHRQMLDQVFAAFREQPDIDLDLMAPNQTLAGITANVLLKMSEVLASLKPDVILVHGDTTTAMAAAMAGFYNHVAIGHVEAGLRSNDLQRPWPEEFNRVAIDAIADYAFAPTESARANLQAEYNRKSKMLVTGNTGIDALLYVSKLIDDDSALRHRLSQRYDYLDSSRDLILVTGHRRESFGDGFERICDGLLSVAQRPDVDLLYPVHLNPAVQSVVGQRLKGQSNIHLIEPVEYIDMVYLMKRAKLIVTDSGGIQEEGPALGRPVLVMRDVTERPEALSTGAVKLIGTDPSVMRDEVARLLDDKADYATRARPVFPYGDGTAAGRIIAFLKKEFAQ
ncbi:MAG: UDP-N-acetylglucosamine 2-epimerase (non-hydrolyzing) [Xanthobacteraceae bacterium]|nr:UDP-N-acetylglucosamine 2-epimerase (non-hydrolyzing) [Xanthobacteraceae bacterium]